MLAPQHQPAAVAVGERAEHERADPAGRGASARAAARPRPSSARARPPTAARTRAARTRPSSGTRPRRAGSPSPTGRSTPSATLPAHPLRDERRAGTTAAPSRTTAATSPGITSSRPPSRPSQSTSGRRDQRPERVADVAADVEVRHPARPLLPAHVRRELRALGMEGRDADARDHDEAERRAGSSARRRRARSRSRRARLPPAGATSRRAGPTRRPNSGWMIDEANVEPSTSARRACTRARTCRGRTAAARAARRRRSRSRSDRPRARSSRACRHLPASCSDYPPAVDFDLTAEQELVRQTVREFALERVAPVAEELDRESRFPYELVAELGRARPDGDAVPRGARRRGLRHGLLRDRRRGADAGRLVARDHARRAHLARVDADLPVRHRGAEAALAARPRLGEAARRVRAHRARGRLRRGRDADARRAARRPVGDQRRRSSSSPTRAPTSPPA